VILDPAEAAFEMTLSSTEPEHIVRFICGGLPLLDLAGTVSRSQYGLIDTRYRCDVLITAQA